MDGDNKCLSMLLGIDNNIFIRHLTGEDCIGGLGADLVKEPAVIAVGHSPCADLLVIEIVVSGLISAYYLIGNIILIAGIAELGIIV